MLWDGDAGKGKMQTIEKRFCNLTVIGGLVVSLNFAHAQTTARIVQSTSANDTGIMSVVAQARALAAEEPVLEQSIPIMAVGPSAEYPPGTYWGMQGTWPPFPFNPFPELPVYIIDPTNRVFLVDDRSVDFAGLQAQQEERAQSVAMAANLMGVPPMPGDGGGEGTNTYTLNGFGSAVDYGTNLWIANFTLTPSNAVGIVSNSAADIAYEIQYKHDLNSSQWLSAGFVLGSRLTNWTALVMANVSLTNNAFFRIRSWISSDGSGLPDWWELQYFGHTGVDPDADSDGDGRSNWDEFEAGTDPTTFNPPGGINTFQAIATGASTVVLTWNPAPGPVTGYTIYRFDGTLFQGQYIYVGVTNRYVDTNYVSYPAWSSPISYTIYANYVASNSGSSTASERLQYGFPSAMVVMGTGGATEIAATGIPVGAAGLAITRLDWQSRYSSSSISGSNTFYVPASAFANGAYLVPTNLVGLGVDGSEYYVQTVWSNGASSVASESAYGGYVAAQMHRGMAGYWPFSIGQFNDATLHLSENAVFLLRAAGLTAPFVYGCDCGYGMTAVNQPTNYVYSSYWAVNYLTYDGLGNWSDLLWTLPFQENYRLRNFVFSTTNIDSWGFLDTGIDEYNNLNDPVTFTFPETNTTGLPNLLSASQTTWMTPYTDCGLLGMTSSSGNFHLPYNISNYFGLHLSAVLLAHNHNGTLYLDTLNAGGTWPQTNDWYCFYPHFDQPNLLTTGYYFGRTENNWANNGYTDLGYDPLPGNNAFSPTTPQPFLIGTVGTPMQIAAFAKQTILNGDTTKPVYVASYFYKAYKMDAYGNVTTNETGVLSPYGGFLPTEPGPTALVTMPASDGQRGTGFVHVVSLQLDANHDGNMDLSYYGPDYTPGEYCLGSGDNGSGDRAMTFWVNEFYTQPGNGATLDQDFLVNQNLGNYSNTNMQPNYAYQQIRCQRNLENFARLWIYGLPNLPTNQGYAVTLRLVNVVNGINGAVNLYQACETNGGTRYLTDTNAAATQVSPSYGNCLARLVPGGPSYTLPMDATGKPLVSHFLFEGAGVAGGADGTGLACIELTASQNGQPLAETEAYVHFYHVKDLYERAMVTNVIQTWPEMVQQPATSGFQVLSTPGFNSHENNQLAVFVHGWRMTAWDWENFSDLMFKRLYWQGYQGKFASLRWPTRSADTDTNLLFGFIPSDKMTYNRSEHIAFESGTGAAAYFNNLRNRYTNFVISACSHSMGGIVMMEALKELAAANQAPLDNYVLMQAAVPAHCYDTSATNTPLFAALEQQVPTPNTYGNYAAGITDALRGSAINFCNPSDSALLAWQLNEGFVLSSSNGPVTMKPNTFFGYSYNPTNAVARVTTNAWQASLGITGVQTRTVTDPLELMPFVARPRSLAIGAQGGVAGSINGGEFNLENQLGFTEEDYDHSGEFNRNIQNAQVQGFYANLVIKMFP
jgi:hypothetical protein